MKKLNLTAKLMIGVTVLSILGFAVMYIVVNTIIHNIIYDNIINIGKRDKVIYADEIDYWFASIGQSVLSMATVLSVLPSEEHFVTIAESFVEEHGAIQNIFIGFADERLKNGIGWAQPDDWTNTDRPWFIAAVAAGEGSIGVTDPYWSYANENVAIGLGTWLPELSGVGAVVGAAVSVNYAFCIIDRFYIIEGGYLALLGPDGEIIVHPNPRYAPAAEAILNIRDIPNGEFIIENIAAGVHLAEFDDFRLGPSYLILTPVHTVGWTLVAVIPMDAKEGLIAEYLSRILFVLAGILAAMLLFSVIMSLFLARNMEESQISEERLRIIFDNMPLSCHYRDKAGNVLRCNNETLRLLGVKDANEYAERFFDLCPEYQPDGMSSKKKIEMLTIEGFEKGILHFEWMHQLLDGELLPCEVYVQKVAFRDNNEYLLVFARDLREYYERQRAEIAEESSRAKTQFLARMSHEIRTPITAVLGISEIHLRRPGIPRAIEEAFAKIYNSANILTSLVNDILDFSKIESGKMEIFETEYEVVSLISDAAQLYLTCLDDKDVGFNLSVDENLPAFLIGDALRIRQIMNNILSNAFKYTDYGSVTLDMAFRDGSLLISVKDTGRGMTQQQLDNLHDEYARFHERTDPSIKGTGLGMAIVYNLAKLMNAEVEIKSEVELGTFVLISIPQGVSRPEILGKEMAGNLENFKASGFENNKNFDFEPEPMPYGRVLIVEDVEANLYVAKGLMEFYSLDIDTCKNGSAAIKKVESGNVYDIIFMDQMMPDMTGTEATKIMRNMGYTEPIVALTANALVGQAEEFMRNGFDDFISKPIKTKHLDYILTKFIRNKQPLSVLNDAAKMRKNKSNVKFGGYMQSVEYDLKLNFVKDQKNAFVEISKALEDNDIKTAHRLTHNLKGLAAMINEMRLAEIAGELELLLHSETVKTVQPGLLDLLKKEHARVIESIPPDHKLLEKSLIFDRDKGKELFDKLEDLLSNSDGGIIELIPELEGIPEAGVLVWQVKEFEFEAALATLRALRKVLDVE